MKYIKFDISSYRAVDKAEVAVSNNLIPIIGINESGKTTILQAILAFDKNKDRYNSGIHLKYKNKYEIGGGEDFKVSANILIETLDDLEFIKGKLGITENDNLYKLLLDFYNRKKEIILSRNFPGKKYSLENIELTAGTKKQQAELANALYEKLPFILYFDDFSDRVPEAIEFSLTQDVPNGYICVGNEWHFIIEEIFKRATERNHTLKDFIKMTDADDQKGLMDDIQDILQKEVIEDWKNLKKYGNNLADEPEQLDLVLDWAINDDKNKITFKFQIKDSTNTKGRYFNITERSKGFQWFFNFIIKLKFNPKYQENQKGAIYLLDEPGSYLHTSAQEELLKKLRDISDTNTILYCTHSQYLLDPETINISRIRIAKKEKGKIKVTPFSSAEILKNQGALTPLYQALHVKSGVFNREIKFAVITEGITDFYLFKMLKTHLNFFNDKIEFIPGAGADNLSDLISLAIAFSRNYLVLFDFDDKGRIAYLKYKEYFGENEAAYFFHYKLPVEIGDVLLENYLSKNDSERLLKITSASDIKAALPIIYYANIAEQEKFIKNLDKETLKNLEILKGKINSISN